MLDAQKCLQMPLPNSAIGQIFNQLADLLEIEGANPFRVRAYRNAAIVIRQCPKNIAESVARGEELPKFPGLGKDLSGKVVEIARTGQLGLLNEVEKRLPRGLSKILMIPGLGPKRVLALKDQLHVQDVEELKDAALSGKVRALPGFGVKIEQTIIEALQAKKQRILLDDAEQIVTPLLRYLRGAPGLRRLEAAGSFRRRAETVGDIDLLATADRPQATENEIMNYLVRYDQVSKVLARGSTKASVRLHSGIQVDLRLVSDNSYGAALVYFTGSKAHNIAIRTLGLKRGLKLNEYGVFRGPHNIPSRSEQDVYHALGLPWIPPELRENRGELAVAIENALPQLVSLDQIRGDLHAHTVASDGHATLEDLARAAEARGYEYVSVTDHSPRLTVARGLDRRRLLQQFREIDQINHQMGKQLLLKSSEVDILEDGSLDWPDDLLKELDLTVCSVHSRFNLSRTRQTERILRAMDHRSFNILAHSTGRLIGKRPGYDVDLEKLMQAARERGCYFELNSQPDRLDLSDLHCQLAKQIGVKIAISTDSHHLPELDYMRFGVAQARRGWLSREDVLNTRSWPELKRLLKR